jgi:two-component system OmpR family sensor kinase
MMKLRRVTPIALMLIPLVASLIVAIILQSQSISNPILLFQERIDLGTLLLIIGGLLTVSLIGFWLLRQRAMTRYRITLENVSENAKQERRRFLQQLVHELKNPLTALKAEVAYLSDGLSDEMPGKVITDINAQIERIGNLIADLRKLTQIEEQPIEFEPVDINELLKEIVEAVTDHPGFLERHLQLTLLQQPWKLPSVPGDRGLLWLACYNLVDNALKFTPPAAEIEVRAFEARPWLIVEVTDNGPGIPPEELPHLFEELYRGKNSHGCPGSGLGLAMVQAIVARHKGDISVRSRFGQGTLFTMRLPVIS